MDSQQAALLRLKTWWESLPFATEEDEILYSQMVELIENFWYT